MFYPQVRQILKVVTGRILDATSPASRLFPSKLLAYLSLRRKPVAGDSYYGEKAHNYENTRLRQPWWHEENEVVEAEILKLENVRKALDVPCGTGRFAELFSRAGISWEGLDASSEMIEIAQEKAAAFEGQPKFAISSATELPYEESSFDLVICLRFLRSIVPLGVAKDVMAELGRVTDRYAILELDIRDSTVPRWREPSDKLPMRDWLYFEEIENLLRQAKLRVTKRLPLKRKGTGQTILVCEKIS